MIVKVIRHDRDFFQMDNAPMEDRRLSWKAKGLLAYLVSRPHDWIVRLGDLEGRSTDGRSAVRSGLEELKQFGYAEFHREHREDGTFECWWVVYERPSAENQQPQSGNPPVDNRTYTKTDCTKTKVTSADNHNARKQITYSKQELAIAKACALDLQTITGKHLGMLRNAGRKLAEVDDKTILGFRSWWKTRWEGRGGGAPRLDELLNKWGAYMENRKPPPGEDREWIETVKAAAAKAREQCQKSATSATSQ